MGVLLDFLLLFTLLLEFAVLCYIERKAWNTLYTPLNFLMIPYVIILLLSVCIAGRGGFVAFYYPSILVWIVGLPLFAIPSFVFAASFRGYLVPKDGGEELSGQEKTICVRPKSFSENETFPLILFCLGMTLCLLFIWHFRAVASSSTEFIGSDQFAEDFSGHGLWAHLRMMLIPIFILSIYFVSKRRWYLWLLILPTLLVMFINQVKGWIVIPVIAGFFMRLYVGKTRLSLKLLLSVVLGGALVFLISYVFLPVLGKQGTVNNELYEFVFDRFSSYLTAGVFGFSQDAYLHFPDRGEFDILISQFVNLAKTAVGDEDLLSPVNQFPLQHCANVAAAPTNVRTLFGTIYIYTNWLSFSLYTLVLSTMMYMLKVLALRSKNVYVNGIFFFECSLLAMGWFEFYFFHLTVVEIPVFFLVYALVASLVKAKSSNRSLYAQVAAKPNL